MNDRELRMVEILKDLKADYGAVSVRADFEAEGTRLEEILRLKEICMAADMGLNLKIGGCESVRDLLEAHIVGVEGLTAPMIESAYALRKYLQAVSKVFSPEELSAVEVLCNIESIISIQHLDEILAIPEIALLKGIVIARVDLCYSLGMDDKSINDPKINTIITDVIKKAKKKNLICAIGGGVSAHSLPFFCGLPQGYLDRFQTRKICFDSRQALKNDAEKGLFKALTFEFLWLKSKHSRYVHVSALDKQRMTLIEEQYLTIADKLI